MKFLGKSGRHRINFGTDKNNKRQYKEMNRFSFYDGFSSPQIITIGIKTTFRIGVPLEAYQVLFHQAQNGEILQSIKRNTKIIIVSFIINGTHKKTKNIYNRLYENRDASLFLKERVEEVKKNTKA